jgi:hypothetical protein
MRERLECVYHLLFLCGRKVGLINLWVLIVCRAVARAMCWQGFGRCLVVN